MRTESQVPEYGRMQLRRPVRPGVEAEPWEQFLGGCSAPDPVALLEDEGLDLKFIEIENETRTNVVILGEKDENELAIRSAGPAVTEEKVELISRLIMDIAKPPGLLVLSGSLPPGMRDDIYASLITYGKSQGMKTVLDSHDEPLRLGIEAGPYLIKPNILELSNLAGREFAGTDAIIEYCRGLIERGVIPRCSTIPLNCWSQRVGRSNMP